jgi:hypothetical protein
MLVLLTFFVGFGVVLTSVAPAAQPSRSGASNEASHEPDAPERWIRSVGSLDLATKLQNWKPRIRVDSDGEGVNLSRPFGDRGPALRLSTSMPEPSQNNRDVGAGRFDDNGGDLPDAYLYFFKRW